MTDPQSKTIKQVLEDLLFNHMTRPGGECVDLALSDISKIIDEAKPSKIDMKCAIDTNSDVGAGYTIGYNYATDQYQDNLKETLR